MSSLAAARADNFYYPPQYDPSKGSLNKVSAGRAMICSILPSCQACLPYCCTDASKCDCLSGSSSFFPSQFNGQHPLRERAKKLGEGILIIRFEMPFNVWCGKCNHLIGKGVRFNAEKKVGL